MTVFAKSPCVSGFLFVALVLFIGVNPARSEIVAEWKFDGAEELTGGAMVALDKAASGASTQSELMPLAKVFPGTTGLGEAWQPWLRSGYLESTGNDKALAGLVTKPSAPNAKNAGFARYLGKAGIRSDGGGCIYVVVSPTGDWTSDKTQGLFGTGHRGEGFLNLYVKSGTVFIAVGGRKYGLMDVAEAKASYPFEAGKWYFIGASWQGGRNPVLYVRKMDDQGPASSPKAGVGEFTSVCEIFEQPGYDPMVLGASWVNTGGESFTLDGAEGKMAYVAVDNRPAKSAEMKSMFETLGANGKPNP